MPTTVHLASVGAGKTEFALRRLLEFVHHQDKPFLKTWILLATRRQEVTFRQRLVELESQFPVFFNVEFFNFYTLNTRLLNIAGKPPRKIQSSARVSILRTIVAEMLANNELNFFHEIAHTPGFIAVLADLIDELKQNSVQPEIFEAGASNSKDIEISKIYHRYQDTLIDNSLVDLEGEGWLALETLQDETNLVYDVDLLLVDGYDQFTPVQANLLAELGRTIPSVDITLTTVPDRGADYARRFSRALERLKLAHEVANVDFQTDDLPQSTIPRHADLDELGQRIFQGQATHPHSEAIQLIEMPTPAEEVKAVLRAVKQQLFDGIQPDDILIALRDWTRYESFMESYQSLYNLPMLLHHRPAYHKTPVIAVLIDLLELAPNFRRRDVLDVLRSPYIESGLTSEEIDLLDHITLEKNLIRGTINAWLEVIEFAGNPSFDSEEEETKLLLTPAEASELSLKLETFLEGITPPSYIHVEDYVNWIELLIGRDPNTDPDNIDDDIDEWYDSEKFSLHIAKRIYEGDSSTEAIIRRDISALNGMKTILRYLLTTDIFLQTTLNQETSTDWASFWADLRLSLQNTVDMPANPSRSGRVLVTTASDARGLPHDHVYILGMAEGVFPAEVSEDPLYLDSERLKLQKASVLLETQADRIDDQGLFYELISLPRQTLTLSRPTVQDGKVWIESHLWRAVRNVFPALDIQEMSVGQVVAPEQSASQDEMMLAVAHQLNHDDVDNIDVEYALRIQNGLHLDAVLKAKWQHILQGRMVDNRRLSGEPHDEYSGMILHPDLQNQVAELLGANRVWSASQLKDYGLCGFRFYAKRILRLKEISEPEEGYDILQLGLINHKILEMTYKDLRDLPIHPDNQAEALHILDDVAREVFDTAPEDFNFQESPLWEQEKQILLNRLRALVTLDFSESSPLNHFGGQREVHELEKNFSNISINLSDDIEPLKIRGFIDRIDQIDGNKLIVVDYKTGSSKIDTSQMTEGRDFQMMVYILALMTILETTDSDLELAGGMFWHLRSLDSSGVFDVQNIDDRTAIESARGHITRNLKAGRKGQFAVHANHLDEGKCFRYCEYSHLCRMSVTNAYKSESV